MKNIFFTSDTHFNHKNIINHCGRPFGLMEEMNETIVQNWNKRVHAGDIVYHLGDFGWGDSESIFRRLNGQKYLIKGNHDTKTTFKYPWGWVKSVYYLRAGVQLRIWLSHYPHRSWRGLHLGSYHLFGHTHGSIGPYGLSFDVGVDCWDYKPIHLDEVIWCMQNLGEKTNGSYL